MIKLKIKPLSVNRAFQGRRFRTPEYDTYEKHVIWSLPPITLPPEPYHLIVTFGMSNLLSDVDNPVKPFMDCLQKKYRFNDKQVHKITVEKVKTKKGEDFISFVIESKKHQKENDEVDSRD